VKITKASPNINTLLTTAFDSDDEDDDKSQESG
jgi:hypothetical protein